jgi:hypothetical protein
MKANIIILTCGMAIASAFSSCSNKSIDLLKGNDLSNWEFVVENNAVPADSVYSIKDGVVSITGNPFGYMYTKDKYSNYTLHAEWKFPVGNATNSGIFLLIEEPSNPFPNGTECNLMAGNAGQFVLLGGSDLKEYVPEEGQERPKFPKIEKKEESSEKEAGQWNEADIDVQDGVITVVINGVKQNVGTNPNKTGHIGLQSEGGPVQFRNVRLTLK